MSDTFARQFFATLWSTIMIRGLVSLGFGLLAFLYPGITVGFLVRIFGIYAMFDGVIANWAVLRSGNDGQNRLSTILQGLVGILAGVFCFFFPDTAAIYLVILIGLWNMAVGALQIFGAIALRDEIDGALWLGLSGLAAVLLGLLIIVYPATGAISILWLIAGTAVVVGLILIFFAWKLRAMGQRVIEGRQ